MLYRTSQQVLKLHRPGTDPVALAQRLRLVAATPEFVPPLSLEPLAAPVPGSGPVAVRWATRWPLAEVLLPDTAPDRLPWREAGSLLARVHSRAGQGVPANGLVARIGRVRRVLAASGDPEARVLADLADRLPDPEVVFAGTSLVHGDWHLGQLGRLAGQAGWRLLDPDDLGSGDAAADFTRPAALWAAGLLGDTEWRDFLDGYRAAAQTRPGMEPNWPRLDASARWGVVIVATALLRRGSGLSSADRAALTRFTQLSHRMLAEVPPNLEA